MSRWYSTMQLICFKLLQRSVFIWCSGVGPLAVCIHALVASFLHIPTCPCVHLIPRSIRNAVFFSFHSLFLRMWWFKKFHGVVFIEVPCGKSDWSVCEVQTRWMQGTVCACIWSLGVVWRIAILGFTCRNLSSLLVFIATVLYVRWTFWFKHQYR